MLIKDCSFRSKFLIRSCFSFFLQKQILRRCWSVKQGVLKACDFIKNRLQNKCFPVKFAKFWRTSANDCFCFLLDPFCFPSLALLKLPLKNQISVAPSVVFVRRYQPLYIMVPKGILDYQCNYHRNFALFQENITHLLRTHLTYLSFNLLPCLLYVHFIIFFLYYFNVGTISKGK